ncbi:dihydropteroate synthase [Chitinibacter bivalviorum]|uniref:Dihydropteroate synthase n=1 Tax=Chitinibacter bivalviorum TaxID=2739434 RepID=A0A7H9BLR8_9NEIS|nr:dihydropteroate synthase [Chitinibacter bivalviorum]QLG88364.1 dihydropteroate synthase [Chitinibacter bivalviorum]
MTNFFQCGRFQLSLSRPLVMGIVNVTPDSFSDGGQFNCLPNALKRIEQLIEQGADIIDIGGESTRPGATPVPIEEELARVIPVIQAAASLNVPLSIDTCKPAVMRAALEAGVDMVNDIAGLEAPGALAALQQSNVGICLMHKQGDPQTMQSQPVYNDVVAEVTQYLQQRCAAVQAAGIASERVLIDLGFGFGKNLAHNCDLFRAQQSIVEQVGYPMLVGVSRKRMLGEITGREVQDRMVPSVVAALLAVQSGAQIVRVHDVRETVDALKLWRELK